jgi:ribose 5-phosphate isomerase RpiB
MASIAIGSDNAAFEPKDVLAEHLREGGPGAVLLTRRYRFWSAARG